MIQKLTSDGDGPYQRPQDSWTRVPASIDALPGEGTSILIKKRSLRSHRRQFTLAITAFTFGALLILMQSPIRNEFLAPGPLTSNHAQILAGQGTDRCAACHSVGNQTFSQWLQNAFLPGRNVQACQSELCMKCHEKTINAALATEPHNVAADELCAITDRISRLSPGTAKPLANNDIQCSACHREHHGPADLTRLTDQQCQTCHSAGFHNFETDHPEFVNWPQQRRQGIAFDHVSHSGKHFQAKGETFDCSACHVGGEFGNVQRLLPYEQSCARCHDGNIVGRSEPGLRLVSLPMLDLDAIKAQQLSVGDWPENASGDFDGPISGLMRLLLQSDDRASKILDRRGPEFNFADLDPDLENDVAEAVDLAWAIKNLLYDLAAEGTSTLRQRFDFVLGRPISSVEFEILTGGLESQALTDAANHWFPSLATEVPLHRVRIEGPSTAIFMQTRQTFGRFADDDDVNLLAVNPLARLMADQASSGDSSADQELDAVSNNTAEGKTGAAVASNPPAALGTGKDGLQIRPPGAAVVSNSPPAQQGNPQPPANSERPNIPESELLADNPIRNYRALVAPADSTIADKLASDSQPETSLAADSNITESNGPSTVGGPPAELRNDISDRVADSVNQLPDNMGNGFEMRRPSTAERLIGSASAGFWVRNDRLYQIKYMPTGHADKILATWLNVIAETPEAAKNPATATAFGELTSARSLGGCNECHTIDTRADNSFRVNWQPLLRDPQIKSFTKFSHGPHLIQPQLADCTSCHLLNSDLPNAQTFTHFDATDTISNFSPITKSNCVSCHQSGGTDNSCTQCHNYHVGKRVGASQ